MNPEERMTPPLPTEQLEDALAEKLRRLAVAEEAQAALEEAKAAELRRLMEEDNE